MRLAAVLVLTACGRLGFDDVDVSSDAPAATAALCNPHLVTALSLAGEPTRVRAMIADITRSAVFWVAGSALRVGTPCLR